jgi:uncharacterized protein (DUF433 family)
MSERLSRERLEERFWAKVDKRGPHECWLWTGSNTGHPGREYGRIYVNGKRRPVAQVAWELMNGSAFPDGMMACHTCDCPQCVNPAHIFVGTMVDNLRDCVRKHRHGSVTHPENQVRGERHGHAKLTERDVAVIHARYLRGGVLQRELAHEYGVTQKAISLVLNGTNWAHALAALDEEVGE